MKQTIEIEVPDGYKAVYNEDTQRVIIIKVEKPKVELPKTWEEFCKRTPVTNEETYIDCYMGGRTEDDTMRDVIKDRALLPDYETAVAFLALMQLIQLRDCYRQGWKPDWIKGNYNAVITYGRHNLTIDYPYWGNRILSFQTVDICEDFLENFRELIEKAKELI